MYQSVKDARPSRSGRMAGSTAHGVPARSLAETLATEVIPALADAAADGEMAVRRALERTATQRAAMADFARSRPLLTLSMVSALGLWFAMRVTRPAARRRRGVRRW